MFLAILATLNNVGYFGNFEKLLAILTGVTIPSALKTKVTAKPGSSTDESERS